MQRIDNLDLKARLVLMFGAGLAIYLILAPLGMLLFAAFRGPSDFLPFESGARWTLENLRSTYSDPAMYTRILPDTFRFVVGSVALTFILAFGLAWLVERTDLPGREVWFAVILFPLLVPIPVLAIAWIFLMGPNAGWLNLVLRWIFGLEGPGPINIFSMSGLILCQSLASVPYVFVLLTAALRTMNPALEEASGISGARPLTTFRRVTLPVLLPGLLAPLILIILITSEQFELPLIIGLPARIIVFSYRIYYELNPAGGLPNYGGAAAVSLPFIVFGVLLLLLYNRTIRRAESFVTVTGKAYRQRRLSLGVWRAPALVFVVGYVLLAAIVPAAVLLWTSFFVYTLPTQASLSDFSIEPYRQLFANPAFWIGLKKYGAGRGTFRSDRDRYRRDAWLDHFAFANPGAASSGFLVGDVGRHSGGDRRPRCHDALSIDADRDLWNHLDPRARLFLSLRDHDPARARGFPANPQGVGGSLGAIRGALADDAGAYSPAFDPAGAHLRVRFAFHYRGAGIHHSAGAL